MPNLEDVLLRGTRAAQPLATAVPSGTLYFVTNENVTEQSNGSAWVSYSGAGLGSATFTGLTDTPSSYTGQASKAVSVKATEDGLEFTTPVTGGITQLTGDVTAGPGSGSQIATIPNATITYAKIQDISAVSRLLGRGSAGGAGDTEEITLGSGLAMTGTVLSSSGGSGDWTTIKTQVLDQDVVNSSVLVPSTDLILPVLAGEAWLVELLILYSATDVTRDFLWDVDVTAGTMQIIGFYNAFGTADGASLSGFVGAAVTSITDIGIGVAVSHGIRVFRAVMTVVFSANADFRFRFAEFSPSASTEARLRAGSILRGKKIV